ncbi:MAG: acetyl-CoA carboxylase biotin carboxyl carrier protein subunit [Actinobacteria bacterium]|nr:acetyl-CoA carboxylase biotin carboxyl carrier protein subunit [Actinomycetota bacterium]
MAESVIVPMVGKVVEVHVKPGDHVSEDDPIITMEAMKTEMPLVAPTSGTIKEVRVSPGQMVEADDVVAIIE